MPTLPVKTSGVRTLHSQAEQEEAVESGTCQLPHAVNIRREFSNARITHRQPQTTYAPRTPQPRENPLVQIEHLDRIAAEEITKVEMSTSEIEEKEDFRKYLETIMQQAFAKYYSGDIENISLVGFGSLASGFGMPGSDMDLAVVPTYRDPARANDFSIDRGIPRLLERAVLDAKLGGRLLTRTRVPILKICQSPTETLYTALFEERQKWDELPDEEKYPSDATRSFVQPKPAANHQVPPTPQVDAAKFVTNFPTLGTTAPTKNSLQAPKTEVKSPTTETSSVTNDKAKKDQNQRSGKQWSREKVVGPLDFPKTGCGIQCDINFENPLGIHNTHMLKCYSLTDPRVRPMVLFVKSWAKRRKVNSAYSGTLSSYGWVLMVLHYLVNIAYPPVCPNLQLIAKKPEHTTTRIISGYQVRFWRHEHEIIHSAQTGQLTENKESLGSLLRGFFQYYASLSGYNYPRPPQFHWTNEVLSLRTPGGILTKQAKGWVSATTKITAEKKVTNRYLFAIEDPFEVDHNVARTVTHRGIVTIRDEFRRAWRIVRAVGQGFPPEGGIFDEVFEYD
ncbi:PAP/OAS1 substrate-binding domain-containing protein [Pyrenophora tritici-repentis]|nr:PAP/OAS1 substrate-binding domain-containing protein [Pyrenophora tritici-repentis]